MNGPKYRDREWLKKKYGYNRMSTRDIASEFGVNPKTVWRWVDKYGLNRYRRPWECPQLMHYLYVECEMSIQDICKELNGTPPTVLKCLREHRIQTRPIGRPSSQPYFYTHESGYEVVGDGDVDVYVHRLLAIANGHDPYEVFNSRSAVHHTNNIPWDNRPENLNVMSTSDHAKHHYDNRTINDKGQFA